MKIHVFVHLICNLQIGVCMCVCVVHLMFLYIQMH